MSQAGYEELSNNFHIAQNLIGNRKRSTTVVNHTEMNMLPSPKSFDDPPYPDIAQDLNLESLSNGDLSRVDNASM